VPSAGGSIGAIGGRLDRAADIEVPRESFQTPFKLGNCQGWGLLLQDRSPEVGLWFGNFPVGHFPRDSLLAAVVPRLTTGAKITVAKHWR
jgi:hypothetical protein